MRRITLPSVGRPALPHFSVLSHRRHDFRKKVIENKICVLILSEKVLILRRIKRDIVGYIYIYIYIGVHVKYLLFWSDCNQT